MKIVILNTKCSNISSVKCAINRIGYKCKITSKINDIQYADKIVIPGVGTAKTIMHELKEKKLISILKKCCQPVLGICLGMQLLGKYSDENNGIKTLNIMNEKITLLKKEKNFLFPHIGWNTIKYIQKSILFYKIPNNSYFYFVHSFSMNLNKFTLATCKYSSSFSAAVQKKNFFGVQFHPEKSGENGSQLLKNFLEI